jgi:hypothetical protein
MQIIYWGQASFIIITTLLYPNYQLQLVATGGAIASNSALTWVTQPQRFPSKMVMARWHFPAARHWHDKNPADADGVQC